MIGGNTGINKRVDVLETEVYSPDFDQWTTVTPISMGQSEAGACVVSSDVVRTFHISDCFNNFPCVAL